MKMTRRYLLLHEKKSLVVTSSCKHFLSRQIEYGYFDLAYSFPKRQHWSRNLEGSTDVQLFLISGINCSQENISSLAENHELWFFLWSLSLRQQYSFPQHEHHTSRDASLTHSYLSQPRKKISVVESSDAVFAERKRIIVFHKKFGESILSENQGFSLKIYKRFFCIYFR